MDKSIVFSLRLSAELNEDIKRLAANIGSSQNSTILNLIYWGMKVYASMEQAIDENCRFPQDNQ